MSLARLTKRLRKSRATGSDGTDSSASQTLDGSIAPSDLAERPPAPDGGRSEESTTTSIVPEPILQADQVLPFEAIDAIGETSAMSGALADLAPMNARLESGPKIANAEQKLDTIGLFVL